MSPGVLMTCGVLLAAGLGGALWGLWLLARIWPALGLGPFMRHERWHDALFMHWPLPASVVQRLLPAGLIVDTTLDGAAWVGLVLLTEEGVSPGPCHGWLPAVSHHGANVRTYVHDAAGGRPGIFFLSLECGSLLASLGARLFAIPYWPATMARRGGGGGGGRRRQMTSRRWLLGGAGAGAELDCEWTIGDAASVVNADPDHTWARQSRWFLERYRLYTAQRGQLYTGTISHPPWPAVPAAVERLDQSLTAAVQGLPSSCASAAPAHCCFSPGVGPVDFTMLRTATGAGQADQP